MTLSARSRSIFRILLILLVIATLTGAGWFLTSLPSLQTMVPAAPILVDILAPLGGTQVGLREPVAIQVLVMGEAPITSVTLWVDGQLLGQRTLSGNSLEPMYLAWTWQPQAAGLHVILARAQDVNGRISQSMLVSLSVLDTLPSNINAIHGQTLADIAEQWDISASDLAIANPSIYVNAPLSGGEPVTLPVVNPAVGSEPPAAIPIPSGFQEPSAPPVPVGFWLSGLWLPDPVPPTAPDLAIGTDTSTCRARLFITPGDGNESGFTIYRWRSGETGFSPLATIGPSLAGQAVLFMDPTPMSAEIAALYYVSAFNPGGEGPSNLVAYPPNPCLPGEMQSLAAIKWVFAPSQPVDQAYCYQSIGDDAWQRVPEAPFTFLPESQTLQVDLSTQAGAAPAMIRMDCWGWVGGSLQYLGQGQADLNPPGELVLISGEGFLLTGTPVLKTLDGDSGFPTNATVPAPFALRLATSVADCFQHTGGNILAGFVCKGLMESGVTAYQVAVWEWVPKMNWSCLGQQNCVTWLNEIDGYYIYENIPNKPPIKVITDPGQKVAAFPIVWAGGSNCYSIQAFVDSLEGELLSERTTYCLGQTPQDLKTIVLEPSDWMTFRNHWVYFEDACGDGGMVAPPLSEQAIAAGAAEINDDDCGSNTTWVGAVKFEGDASEMTLLSQMAVVKATLHLSHLDSDYSVTFEEEYLLGNEYTGVASNIDPLCPINLGTARIDWTSLSNASHFLSTSSLNMISPTNMLPYSAIQGLYSFKLDVTPIVQNWLAHPEKDNGFLLYPATERMHEVFYSNALYQTCINTLGGFLLEIKYYTPPGQ